MPQFDKKTHPARDRLEVTGRTWPALWAACDEVRAEHPQDVRNYLNDFWGARAWVTALHASGDDEALDIAGTYTELEAARVVVPITTMACWRMTQGIYRVDSTVYESLIHTPLAGELPVDVLMRMPEWCLYIETPGLVMAGRDGGPVRSASSGDEGDMPPQPLPGGGYELRGAFVRLDCENSGTVNLVITLDLPASPNLEAQSIPLRGTIDSALTEAIGAWQVADPAIVARVRGYIDPIVNLLLYVCAAGSDISGRGGKPGNPEPKRTRRDGWRLFAANTSTTWDVGVRMGTALRAAAEAERARAQR